MLSFKAILVASLASLAVTLFIGCFANAPSTMDQSFSGEYWYYLNRGYPSPWAGVSLASSVVRLPLVRLPFLSPNDGAGTALVKILDLSKAMPLFLTFLFIAYIPSYIFDKATEENKQLNPFLTVVASMLVVANLFIYFFWFSGV